MPHTHFSAKSIHDEAEWIESVNDNNCSLVIGLESSRCSWGFIGMVILAAPGALVLCADLGQFVMTRLEVA